MAKVGRPSEYDFEKLDKQIDEYLSNCHDEYKTRLVGERLVEELEVHIPTFEGFMLKYNVASTTFYDWKEKYPEFSESLNKILYRQKEELLNKGLAGTYNPLISKLGLSANHGMREKSDITSDDKPIQSNTITVKHMDKDESSS